MPNFIDTIAKDNIQLTATIAELNRACDVSGRIVAVTGSSLTLSEATHDSKIITLSRAAGQAITLPAATGSGAKYMLILLTTITSNSTTIKVTGDDVMIGNAIMGADGGDTSVTFECAADTDTITFNGSTTGGIRGDKVELMDIAADTWFVKVRGSATGSEATPFSATVT